MKSWYDFWQSHYSCESGWDTAESEAFSWAEGSLMVQRLRSEVEDFAEISDERYRPPTVY
ncbi:hypothetical protein B7R25_16960 [Subtercola boreus]|uniref:Uncharacterized protein n=1 Tax=Subtercola boreus TaxID=120213 RepID=A0A3E0W5V0_9MICO|nr:hypothetical protein B7R24_16895 [Subtercola boreus]RFA24316.1 hypothetical protein B7R25_16960 [Subtercola boreus]